ncbi:hypothetical protein DMB38_13010 [Streptomyces sp. WAC 06738]|uniref:hypothetical protein n=1 Tax=Streptomyces sp. WAC 06738 TaxID=2203210 RepID=UPI000F6BAA62|nr:hypothetical protein [Streptomyces sp. WAC 06738]AZM46612.1 hypothetical protein DMB38_13010 [Streptomyces sp. WAC 06738]
MNAPTRAVSALADVILRAQENGRRTPMGIAFAIDAARMVMSPETAADLDRLRRLEATASSDLTRELRVALTECLGDAKPATGALLVQLGGSVRNRLAHDRSTQREDWYCMNLAAFMGERMGPVLRRLLDAEIECARLRGRVAELEQVEAALRALLPTEPCPQEGTPVELAQERAWHAVWELVAEHLGVTLPYSPTTEAGKVTRGDAGGITQANAAPTVEVFRAEYEHEITPMESYTTRAVAREHCETEAREVEPRPCEVFELEWRPDPDDERTEELWVVGTTPGDEERTGYSVTAVAIATEYDREADR